LEKLKKNENFKNEYINLLKANLYIKRIIIFIIYVTLLFIKIILLIIYSEPYFFIALLTAETHGVISYLSLHIKTKVL